MYKTLGFRWLFEIFCPASAFVTADRDGARNPQRFIHVPLAIMIKMSTTLAQVSKLALFIYYGAVSLTKITLKKDPLSQF